MTNNTINDMMKRLLTLCMMITLAVGVWATNQVSSKATWVFTNCSFPITSLTELASQEGESTLYIRGHNNNSHNCTEGTGTTSDSYTLSNGTVITLSNGETTSKYAKNSGVSISNNYNPDADVTTGSDRCFAFQTTVAGTCYAIMAFQSKRSSNTLGIYFNGTKVSQYNSQNTNDDTSWHEVKYTATSGGNFFIMGDAAYIVKAILFVPTYALTSSISGESGTISMRYKNSNGDEISSSTMVEEGATIYVSASPTDTENNYLSSLTYGSTAMYNNSTFTMPSSATEVTATFTAKNTPAVTKVEDFTYDGQSHNLITATSYDATLSYAYKVGDGNFSDWSETIPSATNAGTYTVKWKATGGPQSKSVEETTLDAVVISKATPTITTAPTASAITEGLTLASSTLSGGEASVDGTFSWTDNTITPLVSDSEITPYNVTFIPYDAANYNTATTTVNLTVTAANVVTSLAAFVGTKTFTSDATGNWTANSTNTVLYTPITNPQFMALSRADQMAINSTYGLRLGKAQANMGGALVFYVGATSDIAINIKQVQPTDTSDNPLMVDYMGTSFEALTTGNYATAGTNKASGTLTSSNTTLQLTVSGAQAGYYKVYSSTYRFGVTSLTIIPIHSVTAATSTGTDTYGIVAAESTTVAEGATTTITATPATGYQVSNWAVSGEGASISPTGDSNSNTTTLTMGTADATVTCTFAPINYDITVNQPASGGTFTVKVGDADAVSANTTANYNQTITLANTPSDGMILSSYSVTKTTSSESITVTNGQFTMPNEAVTITATFVDDTPAADPVPVIIVAGQSNTDGRAMNDSLPQYIRNQENDQYPHVYWSYGNGTNDKVTGTFDKFWPACDASPNTRWAYDAVVYYHLQQTLNGSDLYVIKESKGGTAINTGCSSTGNMWWSADETWLSSATSADADGQSLLLALKDNIDQSLTTLANANKTADIKFLMWHQGEADKGKGTEYLTQLEQVITYIRNYLVTRTGNAAYTNLPIILGGIKSTTAQYSEAVETAKQTIANNDANIYYVSSEDFPVSAYRQDNLHFNFKGAEMFGKRVYDLIVEHQLLGNYTYAAKSTTIYPPVISFNSETGKVTIENDSDSDATGGTIYYTTDGSTPTSSSTAYSEPFSLALTSTVKAISVKDDLTSFVSEKNIAVPSSAVTYDFAAGKTASETFTIGDTQLDTYYYGIAESTAQDTHYNFKPVTSNTTNMPVNGRISWKAGTSSLVEGGMKCGNTNRYFAIHDLCEGDKIRVVFTGGTIQYAKHSSKGNAITGLETGNELTSNQEYIISSVDATNNYVVFYPTNGTIISQIYINVEQTKHKVTATVSGPDGSGSVVVMNGEEETAYDADTEYVEGTTVTLKAKANEGYQFANWTDADNNVLTTDLDYVDAISANLITLRMTQAVNIKAVFEVETIVKSASVVYDYATATNINTDNNVKRTLTYNNGTKETSEGFRYEREGETEQRVLSFSNTGGFTEGSGLTFGSNSRPFGIEGLKRGDVIRIIHNGTVNTSANAASTGTTITDISDNAFSEGNIASGQEIKVATADATNDYIVLQASANITISQIAINKGIKPRVNLTNIDGNVFTYSAQFFEGEVLHYTGPGIDGEQTVEYTANNNGSVTITADITNGEGNLVCWTTYDDVASDEVTINVAPINDDANTGKDDDIYDFQTWVTEMGAKGTLTRGGSDITVEGSNKVKQIQNIYASGKENNFMETHGRFAINANADVGYDKNDETKRGLRTNGDGRTAYFSILNLKSGDNITINNGVTVEGKSALRFVSTNAHKKGSTTTPSGDADNRTVWTSGDTWVMDADGRLDLMLGDADCMAYIYSIRISNRENVAAATFAKDADDDNKLIITAGTTDVETATTYYTLDGTEPTTSSTAITSSPLTLALTQNTTLITLTVGSTGKTARGYYQFTYTDTTPTAAKTFDFFNIYKNDPTFDLQMEDATKRTAYFAKKDGESMVDNSGNFYAIKASPIDSIIAWREAHVELTANGLKPTNADRPFVIRDLKKNDVIRIEFDGDIYYAKHSTRGNALKDMEPGDAITTRTAYKVASVDDTYNYVVFYPTKATTISQISINEELTPHVLPTVPSVAFSKVEEGKSVYTITYQDGETLHYQLGSDSQVDVTTASPYSLKIDKSATLSAWTSTDDGESGKLSYGVYAPTDSVYADGVYDFTKVAGTTPVEIVTAGQTVGGQTVYAPNVITAATLDRRFAFSSITGTDVRLIGGTGMRVAKGKNIYIALKNLEKDKVLAINFTSTSGDDGIKFKSVSILDGATVDANVVSGKEYTINEAGNILLQVSNANASLDITSIKLGSKMKTEQADVEYQVVNNKATVTGFTTAETASEITIPASVDGAPVTAIAEGTFTEENTANVTSIDLSETAVTFDGTTRETIDELKNINEATLIYLPSTAHVTGTNVVTKTGTGTDATYTCNDYQIKDGQESSVPHAFTAAQAKITRTFTSGVKCTVCLPYQFTASGGSFYKFTGISDGKVQMTEQTGILDANTPYIFVPSSDATEGASASNVTVSISDAPETVDAANKFTFKGIFEKIVWDESTSEGVYGFAALAQDGADVGQFVRVGAGASIDANRAYLKYEGEGTLNGLNSAPRRAPIVLPNTLSIKWIHAQGGATTIRNVEQDSNEDAPAYNLNGQRVGKDYKGIVVVNGKKVRK